MYRPRGFLFGVAFLGLWAGSARGQQTLYAVTFGDQLITINTATGAGTLVGPISPGMNVFGLAFRGNNLYTWDQSANRIRQLNPATGATLGTIDIGVSLGGEGDLAFRNDGMGFLVNDRLYQFDITVPNSTLINPAVPSMDGLAFNGANVLFGLEQGGANLYTINQTTGVATLVGPTGVTGSFILGGLAFDAGGNLFAALSSSSPVTGPGVLYRLNSTTGAATLVGSIGFDQVCGLALQGGVAPPTAGSGNEGTYTGSSGPAGSEGSFGFGGRRPVSVLLGPFQEHADLIVLNASHRPTAQPVAADGSSLPAWAITGLLLALAVALRGMKRTG